MSMIKVFITDCGTDKADVIMALIQITGWDFMKAMQFTDSLPAELDIDEEQISKLEAAGAVISIGAQNNGTKQQTNAADGDSSHVARIDCGYAADWMVNDKVSGKAVLRDAYLLLCDSVDSLRELIPVLETVIKQKEKLVICAGKFDQQILNTLKMNVESKIIDALCINLENVGDSIHSTLLKLEESFDMKAVYTRNGMSLKADGPSALKKIGYIEAGKDYSILAESENNLYAESHNTVKSSVPEPIPYEATESGSSESEAKREHVSWKGWKDMPAGHSQSILALGELKSHAESFLNELKTARDTWLQSKTNSQNIYNTTVERVRKKTEIEIEKIIQESDEDIAKSEEGKKSINSVANSCNKFMAAMPKSGDIRKTAQREMTYIEQELIASNKAVNERTALYRKLKNVRIADSERNRNNFLDRARSEQIERDNQSDRRYQTGIQNIQEKYRVDFNEGFNKETIRAYCQGIWSSRFNASSYECPTVVPDYVMMGNISVVIPDNDQDEKTVVQTVSQQTSEIGTKSNGAYTVSIPYAQRLSDGISLMMRYQPFERSVAQDMLQPLLLKLFMSFPAGKLEATMIDPLELGASFSYIPKLAEGPESARIIDTKIWSKEKDIENAIATLRQRLENMTQAYGGDQESRLKKEVVRALAIADFPVGFNEAALKDLNAIVRNSSSLGVCVFICANEEELENLRQRHGSLLSEIAQSLVETKVAGNRLQFINSNQNEMYLTLDDMKDVDEHRGEILSLLSSSIEHTQLKIEHFDSMYKEDIFDSNNWFTGNHDEIAIPIGIKGADTIVKMVLGRGGGSTEHHALIAGQTGAGKSTLLHTLIMSTLISYSPDEVQMYLLDFKEGVEFSIYTQYRLPSLRVVAINSEREFGLNVLKELCTELETRTKQFTRYGASDINSYTKLEGVPRVPKLLLIFDEVQELFRNKNEGDNISAECLSCLNRLVMQGRAMGIHVILACQDFHNCSGLEAYFSQMAIRIAVKGSEEGAASILNSDNSGIKSLQNQPAGAAIYNGGGGVESANNFFQISYMKEAERKKLLTSLDAYYTDPYVADMYEEYETRILLTNAEDNIHNCFNKLILQGPSTAEPLGTHSDGYGLLLGQGFGKKSVFVPELRSRNKENLLVVSRDEKIALSIFELSMMSVLYDELSTDSDKENALVYAIDLFAGDLHEGECDFEYMSSQFPKQVVSVGLGEMEDMINNVYEIVLRRAEGSLDASERVFLMIFGLNRARKLRAAGMYEDDMPGELSSIEKLKKILVSGPKLGVNSIVWAESIQGIESMLGDRYESLFDKRIAYGLDENSMDVLVAETESKSMRGKTAVYIDIGKDIKNTHFRPYDVPAKVWVERYAEEYKKALGQGGLD